VRGTETPPSWVSSLNEDRDQDDRDCVHGRDLIAGSDTLHECFNNVDVGAPLWQHGINPRVENLLPLILL